MPKGSQSKLEKKKVITYYNIVHKQKCRNGALFSYHRQSMPSQDGNENILTINEFIIKEVLLCIDVL